MSEQGWTRVPNEIARAGGLSWRARLVYLALASRANDDGRCWPSRKTIANDAGVSIRSVQEALNELRDAGLITWAQKVSDDGTPCGASTYSLATRWVGTTRTGVGTTRTPPVQEMPTGVGTTCTQNKTQKNKTQEPRVDDRFDEFWKVYPKRQSKKPAQAAWTKALKTTDADTIITAARRFAETRATEIAAGRSEARFTAYPATWLNQERWTDEPDKPNLTLVAGGYEYDQWRTR